MISIRNFKRVQPAFAFIRVHQVLLFAILVIALLVRLPHFTESLWFDELWSTRIKLADLHNIFWTVLRDVHPPFYSLFMFSWIRAFGDSEVSVRLPSLIFGMLSILLSYVLVSQFIDEYAGLVTAFVLSLSPVHIWYSQEARQYTATAFFILLSLVAYYKVREGLCGRGWLMLYFSSLLCAVFSHYYMVVYVGVITLLELWRWRERRMTIIALNSIIGVLLAVFVVLKVLFGRFAVELSYLRQFNLGELWILFFNWFSVGNSIWPLHPYGIDSRAVLDRPVMLGVQIVLAAVFAYGVIRIVALEKGRKESRTGDILGYLFGLPLVLLILSYGGFGKIYIERSMVPILPFFVMVLAAGSTGVGQKWVRRGCVGLVIGISMVALGSYWVKDGEWTVYKPNPDWRSAAQYFDEEGVGPDHRILVWASTPASVLTYYSPRFVEMPRIKRRQTGGHAGPAKPGVVRQVLWGKNEDVGSQVPGSQGYQVEIRYFRGRDGESIGEFVHTNSISSLYLVENRYWRGRFDALVEEAKETGDIACTSTRSFKGITVYKCIVEKQREKQG